MQMTADAVIRNDAIQKTASKTQRPMTTKKKPFRNEGDAHPSQGVGVERQPGAQPRIHPAGRRRRSQRLTRRRTTRRRFCVTARSPGPGDQPASGHPTSLPPATG